MTVSKWKYLKIIRNNGKSNEVKYDEEISTKKTWEYENENESEKYQKI